MRHEDHRPLERLERVDQHLLGGEIQMIGGLVQDEEIRGVEEQARHRQARLLAARERPDLLVGVVPRELKRSRQGAEHPDPLEREIRLELLEDRESRVEDVERLLGEIAHPERCAQPYGA